MYPAIPVKVGAFLNLLLSILDVSKFSPLMSSFSTAFSEVSKEENNTLKLPTIPAMTIPKIMAVLISVFI